jgi:hypothetical protein
MSRAVPVTASPATATGKWIERVSASFDKDIGALGKRLVECSVETATKSVKLTDQKVEKGTCVLVGDRVRLIFNQDSINPLPKFERTVRVKGKDVREAYAIDINDLSQIVLKFDVVLDQLYRDFPEWNCSRTKASPMNVFIIGNNASNANVQNNASAFSNATHCYLSPQITVAHNYFGFILTAIHEMTHGVDPSPRDGAWGMALGESLARFSEYTYCPGTGNGYTCINAYYSIMSGHVNRYAYSKESLSYANRETFIAYNPTFWIFFAARYGMQTYKRLVSNGLAKVIRTTNLFQGVAHYLGIDKNEFALQWMVDLMTLSFYRADPVRLANAKRYITNRDKTKTCVDNKLIWKDSQHNDLGDVSVTQGVSYTGTMVKRKVEAFALATFDLAHVCRDLLKIQSGTKITVSVQSLDPSAEPDATSWAIAAVLAHDNIVMNASDALSMPAPAGSCILGVIHSKTWGFTDRNTAIGTAMSYRLFIKVHDDATNLFKSSSERESQER